MKFKTVRIFVIVFLLITLVFALLASFLLPGLQTELTIACAASLALTFVFWSQFCKCPHCGERIFRKLMILKVCPHCGKSLFDILSKEERYKEIAPKSAPRLK